MEYEIKKGGVFLCLEDYVMDDDTVAYTKGRKYRSEMYGMITDNEYFVEHKMDEETDFFDYFKLMPKE